MVPSPGEASARMPAANVPPGSEHIPSKFRPATAETHGRAGATSEDPFRLLFVANPAPLYVFDRDTLGFLEVNQALSELYGYSREEFVKMSLLDIRPPEEVPALMAAVAAPGGLQSEGPRLWTHLAKDGRRLVAEVKVTDLEFDGRRARLVAVTDMTSHVAMETALREEHERLSIALETAGMTAWAWDMRGGEMRYQRPGREDVAAPTSGGWDGQGAFLNALPEDRAAVRAAVDRALAGEGDYQAEFRNRDRTGEVRWASVHGRVIRDETGTPVRMVGVAADITEARARSEAIARLASIIESSGDAVISTDLDFNIVSWNPGAERMFGFTAEEAIGRNTEDVFPRLVNDGTAARKDALRDGALLTNVEREWPTKDGRTVVALSSFFPLRDADGKATGYASVARDIGALTRAREDIARLAQIVETSSEAIVSTGLDWRVSSWNPGAERLFGYAAAEAIGEDSRVLFGTLDDPSSVARRALLAAGESTSEIERVMTTRSGEQVATASSSFPIRGADGAITGYASVTRDITRRKRADDLVRESEARFRAFVEAAPSAIWIYDGSDTLFVNDALVAMTGYSREQLTTPGEFDKLFDPAESVMMGRRAQARLRGEHVPPNYEVRITRADGEQRWLAVSAATISLDGRAAVLVNAFDVTDQKAAEFALRESEARFRAVVDSVLTAIWIFDGDQLVLVNQAVCDITGCSREELLSRGFQRLFDAEDVARLVEQSQARLRGDPVPDRYELRIRREDGELRWLDVASSVVTLAGRPVALASALDITDRKRAEQLLYQSEQRFRSLVDNSPDFITRIDRNLEHVFVNATAEREAGLDPNQILGKRADELGYPPEIGALWVARHQQVLDSGEPLEFEYELGTGKTRLWRRCRLIPEFGAGGEVEHVLSVVTDLTAEKRAEEERRRLDLQVQNAQKLESLGVLAGGIAHDFNNLLVAMLGNAGLALIELPPESPARQTVQAIEMAAQRAADLTRQMLAYSGKGRFVIEMLNLSRVVEEMSHLLEVSISRRARLEYHFAPELPPVEADATQIRQVIMNLITNASDAVSERGGTITLRTGVIRADAHYLAGTYIDNDLPEGDYVFVEVADTGEGMDEETRQRIFDPFFTTKFTGRGLGLAAVLGIVRGHRGAIRLESEPGHGTTFTVLLPAAASATNPAGGAEEYMSEHSDSHSATVLIADDDDTVRNVTRRILEHSGYTVLLAADGREAIEIYAANKERVDIVLLDMTMPHMDGEETFRELRLLNPDVRVLLTSGYNEQDATESFAGKGLLGFIQKPYRPNELVDRIEAALTGE